MKITLTIDTDTKMLVPTSDSDTVSLTRYLLSGMTGDLGRYYGRLAAKLGQPPELVSNNAMAFMQQAMLAYEEGADGN